MDYQPLRTVRPLTRLLTQTLESYLSRPSDRLSAIPVDAWQVAASCELAPHHRLLETMRVALDAKPLSISSPPHISRVAESQQDVAGVRLLPLHAARRIVSGLHRFPVASTDQIYDLMVSPGAARHGNPPLGSIASTSLTTLAALKAEVERLVVQRHVLDVSVDEMRESDFALVWSILSQCTEASHREEMLSAFPLVEVLARQSPEEWCAAVQHLSHSPSLTPFESGCEPILRDVLGEKALWARTLAIGNSASTTVSQRATLFSTMLALSHALRTWPSQSPHFMDAAHCKEDPARASSSATTSPTPLNAGSLYAVCNHLHSVHQPWVPAGVRTAALAALQGDLWRLYTTKDVDGSVMFLFYGTARWTCAVQRGVREALGTLHMAMLTQQAVIHSGAVRTSLRLDTYVAVLLVSAFCHGKEVWHCDALRPFWEGLAESLRGASRGAKATASETVAVRTIRPLLATYVAIVLHYTEALTSPGVVPAPLQDAVAALCATCKVSLSRDALAQRGSARVLALLLTHARSVATHLEVEQTAIDLVHAHALSAGFTRQQLGDLMGDSHEGNTVNLPPDTQDVVAQAMAVLPRRAL